MIILDVRQMEKIKCIAPDETLFIFKDDSGSYCCPVCGEPGLQAPPYYDDGSASFEMCSCGFEFGFDDSHLASAEAVKGIKENWKRWRIKVIEEAATSSDKLKKLEANLRNINIRLAFDLIPVEIEKDEQGGAGQRR